MKIKIFTLLLGLMVATVSYAQQMEGVIKKTEVSPVIGGEIDAVWDDANSYSITRYETNKDAPTLGAEGETYWKALWSQSDQGMYLLVVVNDDNFFPYYESVGDPWAFDRVEVYLDVNAGDLADGLGPSSSNSGHYQAAPEFEEPNDGTLRSNWICDYASTVTGDAAYSFEYFIPFATLVDRDGMAIDLEATIGFDISLLDRDEASNIDPCPRAVWSNEATVGESWTNMDDCGLITFEGAQTIFVETLALTGGDITENNGELQIDVAITPADATNKSLNWTVLDGGTGRVSVDANGLVTGILDGTVEIQGETKDGSWLSETVTVNISNQIVTIDDINLVRNPYMDEVDENGIAHVWHNNLDVIDGALYIPATDGERNNWWEGTQTRQVGYGCNATDSYTFSFVMWSDAPDTMYVDFEDSANGWRRYGASTHPFSNGLSEGFEIGRSAWEFLTTVEPMKFIDDNLIFDELKENTDEAMIFMAGFHQAGAVYLDSVLLINNNDMALLTPGYVPVESITVTSAEGATAVARGSALQMSAEVLPAGATLTDARWSVEPGTGDATIDAAGLLTGDTVGMVTVIATAKDDSKVFGSMDIEVTFGIGVQRHSVNQMKVYPNPAVNELNVVLTSENTTVSIYNSVGAKMDEVNVTGTMHSFDISSYASGIYFVKTDNAIAKFVK
ncbi:MAG: Ig-like domain-containing protein [Bacteroidota bacterium]